MATPMVRSSSPASQKPLARLALIVGARPNFMKAAPILRALQAYPEIEVLLVHTGQHYDAKLSDVFFNELGMPTPDVHLQVGSGSHAHQTAQIMIRFEEFLLAQQQASQPIQQVVVVGDVNSTLACALVSAKLEIPVVHVEAGLRSFDRSMPEEINRILTDAISDLLLCSEPAGLFNLENEGISKSKLRLVGNVMIDTLRDCLPRAQQQPILQTLGLLPGTYGVVTLHRPANVDQPELLEKILQSLIEIADEVPLVFAVHPRTEQRIRQFNLLGTVASNRLILLPPQGYLDFLCLTSQAKFIVTDSGGLQDESTALGVPCLTLRPNTERPITVDEGSSTLVAADMNLLLSCLEDVLNGHYDVGQCPELWDGQAAVRIAREIAISLGVATAPPLAIPSLSRAA